MTEHKFGGRWTEEKLQRIGKYLPAYTTIFKANAKAQHLRTVYVDAFAGTGYSEPSSRKKNEFQLFLEMEQEEAQEFLKGSAQIALETDPPFDHYIFVEKKPAYAQELARLKNLHYNSGLSIQVVQNEAQQFLPQWCASQDWAKTRAVVFLDPYANQADWSMLQALSKGKLDLWLLWPMGQVINRLLTKRELPPESWAQALTRAFGTEEWKTKFYADPSQSQPKLFEDESFEPVKVADFKSIAGFFVERLEEIFPFVAPNPLYLYNSQNTPLYLLCFASHNETARKIAQHILRN